MLYADIATLRPDQFKRLTGVQPDTFAAMLDALEESSKWREFGRPSKLIRADQLLMTLMYWREYRTQFHIAQSFGISEPTVCRTIKRVEDALMQSGKFTLPGKKSLTNMKAVLEVVVVDASESPIERPQKSSSSGITTAAKRNATRSNPRSWQTRPVAKSSPPLSVREESTI